jgi:hypothetical protein
MQQRFPVGQSESLSHVKAALHPLESVVQPVVTLVPPLTQQTNPAAALQISPTPQRMGAGGNPPVSGPLSPVVPPPPVVPPAPPAGVPPVELPSKPLPALASALELPPTPMVPPDAWGAPPFERSPAEELLPPPSATSMPPALFADPPLVARAWVKSEPEVDPHASASTSAAQQNDLVWRVFPGIALACGSRRRELMIITAAKPRARPFLSPFQPSCDWRHYWSWVNVGEDEPFHAQLGSRSRSRLARRRMTACARRA